MAGGGVCPRRRRHGLSCLGEALEPSFRDYAQAVIDNARALAETLLSGGILLASGGTDNHLMLADVTPIGLTGKIAEEALEAAGITVNKNMIPFDQRKPLDPSGVRIGTAALTTRGMGTEEMQRVGGWILEVLGSADDATVGERVRGEISDFCSGFPVPGM